MKKILITYYTRTNTTKDISEKIGEILRSELTEVTIAPMESTMDAKTDAPMYDTSNLSDYDAVIIGAPIHGMRWSTEAVNYVSAHASELASTKTAYFFCSYMIKTGRAFWKKAIDKSLDMVNEHISPIQKGKFGGRLDKPFGGFPRLIFGVKKDAPIDVVDWDEVTAFAEKIKAEL